MREKEVDPHFRYHDRGHVVELHWFSALHQFLEVHVNLVLAQVSDIESTVVPEDACMVLRDGVGLSHAPVLWALQFDLTTHFHLELIHEKESALIVDEFGVGRLLTLHHTRVRMVDLVTCQSLLRFLSNLLSH